MSLDFMYVHNTRESRRKEIWEQHVTLESHNFPFGHVLVQWDLMSGLKHYLRGVFEKKNPFFSLFLSQ